MELPPQAEDILDSNERAILGYVWCIMNRFMKFGDDEDDEGALYCVSCVCSTLDTHMLIPLLYHHPYSEWIFVRCDGLVGWKYLSHQFASVMCMKWVEGW